MTVKPRIELVYFQGCPHVEAARLAIRAALSGMDMPLEWVEWDREDDATPPTLKSHGSPTVLVNGCDVVPAQNDGNCCRIYTDRDGMQPAPSVESIRSALAAIDVNNEEDQC